MGALSFDLAPPSYTATGCWCSHYVCAYAFACGRSDSWTCQWPNSSFGNMLENNGIESIPMGWNGFKWHQMIVVNGLIWIVVMEVLLELLALLLLPCPSVQNSGSCSIRRNARECNGWASTALKAFPFFFSFAFVLSSSDSPGQGNQATSLCQWRHVGSTPCSQWEMCPAWVFGFVTVITICLCFLSFLLTSLLWFLIRLFHDFSGCVTRGIFPYHKALGLAQLPHALLGAAFHHRCTAKIWNFCAAAKGGNV